jgi:hypothetical protein
MIEFMIHSMTLSHGMNKKFHSHSQFRSILLCSLVDFCGSKSFRSLREYEWFKSLTWTQIMQSSDCLNKKCI